MLSDLKLSLQSRYTKYGTSGLCIRWLPVFSKPIALHWRALRYLMAGNLQAVLYTTGGGKKRMVRYIAKKAETAVLEFVRLTLIKLYSGVKSTLGQLQ